MPDSTAPLAAPDLSELVRKHLQEAAALSALRSYGALDLTAARSRLSVPCTVALTLDDHAGPPLHPDVDERVVQPVRTTVAVVLGVAATNDVGGSRGTASAGLRAHLAAVRAELLGWAPDGSFPAHPPAAWPAPASWPLVGGRWRPLVLQRGRLLGIGDSRAWWQDEYVSEWLLRSRPRAAAAVARPTEIRVSANGATPVSLREALDG